MFNTDINYYENFVYGIRIIADIKGFINILLDM